MHGLGSGQKGTENSRKYSRTQKKSWIPFTKNAFCVVGLLEQHAIGYLVLMTHLKKITGSVYRSVAVPGNLGDLTNETCCPKLSVIRSSEKSGYKINQLGRICIGCLKMFLGGED